MNEAENPRNTIALERIGKVLGALYASQLGDLDQKVKAERLSRCGFSNMEIADILGTTSNTINVALHHLRRKGSNKKGRKKKRRA